MVDLKFKAVREKITIILRPAAVKICPASRLRGLPVCGKPLFPRLAVPSAESDRFDRRP